jgi:hypothetical protein
MRPVCFTYAHALSRWPGGGELVAAGGRGAYRRRRPGRGPRTHRGGDRGDHPRRPPRGEVPELGDRGAGRGVQRRTCLPAFSSPRAVGRAGLRSVAKSSRVRPGRAGSRADRARGRSWWRTDARPAPQAQLKARPRRRTQGSRAQADRPRCVRLCAGPRDGDRRGGRPGRVARIVGGIFREAAGVAKVTRPARVELADQDASDPANHLGRDRSPRARLDARACRSPSSRPSPRCSTTTTTPGSAVRRSARVCRVPPTLKLSALDTASRELP